MIPPITPPPPDFSTLMPFQPRFLLLQPVIASLGGKSSSGEFALEIRARAAGVGAHPASGCQKMRMQNSQVVAGQRTTGVAASSAGDTLILGYSLGFGSPHGKEGLA